MKFIPNITVSYHGVIRMAHEPFEIDEADEAEMKRYGTVVRLPEKSPTIDGKKPTRKAGRPKRNEREGSPHG